jgi:hypothetical protein
VDGRLVVVIGIDGIELIDVACVTSGFEHANRLGARPAYHVVLATPAGRGVRTDTDGNCAARGDSTRSSARSTPSSSLAGWATTPPPPTHG